MAFVPGYPVYMQPVVKGSTSKSFYIYITAASGLPVAALAFDTAGLLASYAGTKLARVAITLADLAAITTAWTSGGFKQVDGTNMPGWYRLDLPDAALALSADEVVVTIVKDAVCQSSLVIPIPAVTVGTAEAKIDIIDTNVDAVLVDTGTTLDAALTDLAGDVGEPLVGTLAQTVEALGVGILTFDAVNGNTSRTDN